MLTTSVVEVVDSVTSLSCRWSVLYEIVPIYISIFDICFSDGFNFVYTAFSMAGNKVNTKTKGKDDKSKAIKGVSQTNEDSEDLDFAVLRKPVPTSITGFAQARKIFDLATEEVSAHFLKSF